MSGGHFDYSQSHIAHIADELEHHLESNSDKYTDTALEHIKEGLKALRIAFVYAQRIDWLLSGDDSEETFSERLQHDIKEIGSGT